MAISITWMNHLLEYFFFSLFFCFFFLGRKTGDMAVVVMCSCCLPALVVSSSDTFAVPTVLLDHQMKEEPDPLSDSLQNLPPHR